ncbi:aldehyde dehydrogenase family protein [Mycobacterium kansasii 824]|nr:aldehyde dehydrogenase family protein [Mycobacterium kansasii 824]
MTAESPQHRYDELFIGGRWRKPTTPERLSVISPHSEQPVGEAPAAGPGDVEAAVAAARHAFDHGPWPLLDPHERMSKIEQLAAIYTRHLGDMADLITAEMGSPRSFSRLGQAAGAASMIHLALAAAGTSRGRNAGRACSARPMCVVPPSASSAPLCRGTCHSA